MHDLQVLTDGRDDEKGFVLQVEYVEEEEEEEQAMPNHSPKKTQVDG